MSDSNQSSKDSVDSEKPAVKTTIVGARPPGSGKETDSVPRGIEILLKKASVDPAFKEALLKERAEAAKRIELSLDGTEIAMLNSIPQPHLEGVISATKVSPNMKQAFLGCTAAVMLAALTATASAYEPEYTETGGIRPDQIQTKGIRPDIVEYQKAPEPYFKIAESDAQLETGTLKVRVTDAANSPLSSIRVYFVKASPSEKGEKDGTKGLGYTNASGIYFIEGLPEGKYYLSVAKESRYAAQLKDIEIVAEKENLILFQLIIEEKEIMSMGIRPDDPVNFRNF